jgi:G3E family GTPase
VDEVYEIKESAVQWRDNEKRISKFLVIGVNLDKEKIRSKLLEAAVTNT